MKGNWNYLGECIIRKKNRPIRELSGDMAAHTGSQRGRCSFSVLRNKPFMDVLWLHSEAPMMCSQAQRKPWLGPGMPVRAGMSMDSLAEPFFLSSFHFSSGDSVRDTRTQRWVRHCSCPPGALRPEGNKHASKSIQRASVEMTWWEVGNMLEKRLMKSPEGRVQSEQMC